jgi:hypothetical protein
MYNANDKMELQLNNLSEVIAKNGASKKMLQNFADEMISSIINSGELNTLDALGTITKMRDFIEIIDKKLRDEAMHELSSEKDAFTSGGVSFQYREGMRRLNINDDHIIQELNDKIKQRKELLKVAEHSTEQIFDHEGNEVQKVGYSHTKDSIVIKY